MPRTYKTAALQRNIDRAVSIEIEHGSAVAKVRPDELEYEVFLRLKGSEAEPTLLGSFPLSKIRIGGDE